MSFRIFKEFFDLKKLKPKTIESDIFEHVEVPNELKSSMKSVDDEIEIFYETENFTQTEEFKESQNEMKSEEHCHCTKSFCSFCDSVSVSNISLVRKCSSFTPHSSRPNDSYVKIIRIVPIRNDSAIIHWKSRRTWNDKGFKIFVDGNLATIIYSPERTSAFINNVDMDEMHQFSISVLRPKYYEEDEHSEQLSTIVDYIPKHLQH